ncbi:hypothetical protein Nepgr_019739 [Nepenthes gracilis]|uniref:LIM zinc-binding domain-containing protein n=1 Tax=Nepenthes gracilis TaxID=150966 RepID=A0AAD3STZ5_NEPGR|nr:hypothetical protein Nepgr_019739 [Nepenthes gracilis]
MDWLSKTFRGSTRRFSKGEYHGAYVEDTYWDYGQPISVDMWSDDNNEDIDRAIILSQSEEDQKRQNEIKNDAQLEEDEPRAKALRGSLNINSSPHYDHGNIFQPFLSFLPSEFKICVGSGFEIGHGRYLSCMGGCWHPNCSHCHKCNEPIVDHEFSISGDCPYYKSCYRVYFHPKCDVCNIYIPHRAHSLWMQNYYPSREFDWTSRCCGCERMETRDTPYFRLDDDRKLCLEGLDSSIMDTNECQPLSLDNQEFNTGLHIKIDQQIPLLLVERQVLNEAMDRENNGHHHLPETIGLYLSE